MFGNCALCGNHGRLLNSHYIPKAIMRMLSKSGPIAAVGADGATYPLGRHVTKYLLCAGCEEKFSKFGESQVIPQIMHPEGEFALREAIGGRLGKVRALTGRDLPPEVNPEAYKYFVASMIWRGHASSWGGPASGSFTRLGAEDAEALRRYLLGLAPFPKNMLIRVFVDCRPASVSISPFNRRSAIIAPFSRRVSEEILKLIAEENPEAIVVSNASNTGDDMFHFFVVPGLAIEVKAIVRVRWHDKLLHWATKSILFSKWDPNTAPGSDAFLEFMARLAAPVDVKGRLRDVVCSPEGAVDQSNKPGKK